MKRPKDRKSRKDRKDSKKNRKPAKMARTADKYALYQEAVQDPESDVKLAQRVFQQRFGRMPRLLREDFCGAAALACEWVSNHRDARAWGVDLDPEPLDWGRANNVSKLDPDAESRLELIESDVMTASHEPVDVTVAFNFSYFLYHTRSELLAYLRKAHSTLREEGLLMLDLYGGAEAQQTMEETRDHETFDYVWDQHRFDPIQQHAINYIHFAFPDGSKMVRAFHYDWRLWSIPEVRDLLAEAGFSSSEVYWEGTESESGEGNGIYRRAESSEDDPAWVAYVIGIR